MAWITRPAEGQAHRVVTSTPWNSSGHDPRLVHSPLQPLGVPQAVGLVRIVAVNNGLRVTDALVCADHAAGVAAVAYIRQAREPHE